jgi:hypothetical protein
MTGKVTERPCPRCSRAFSEQPGLQSCSGCAVLLSHCAVCGSRLWRRWLWRTNYVGILVDPRPKAVSDIACRVCQRESAPSNGNAQSQIILRQLQVHNARSERLLANLNKLLLLMPLFDQGNRTSLNWSRNCDGFWMSGNLLADGKTVSLAQVALQLRPKMVENGPGQLYTNTTYSTELRWSMDLPGVIRISTRPDGVNTRGMFGFRVVRIGDNAFVVGSEG